MATRTNDLTKSIVAWLCYNGFVAWRNNNGAVYSVKRKSFLKNPLHKNGVFDITGFRKKDGKHLEIAIKTGKDKLSAEQTYHLTELQKANCIAFIVYENFDYFEREIKKYL